MKIAIFPSPENAGSINTFGRKMMHLLFESRSAAIREKKKKKKKTQNSTQFIHVFSQASTSEFSNNSYSSHPQEMDDTDTSMDIITCRRIDFNDTDKEKEPANTSGEKILNVSHFNILEEKIPKNGMEFDTEDAAYNFYNEYAKAMGFSIRRHRVHVDSNRKILDRTFCCSQQGSRLKDKRDVNVKNHRPKTRTGCNALMKINGRHSGKYIVSEFIAEHNGHELASPNKSFLLRSHRHMTMLQVSQANDLESSGIAPKAGFTLMTKEVGDRKNVGFILEDYGNYLQSKRTVEMKIGDTGGVLEYLQQRQLNDPNFFSAIQVDEDDLITNVLWMDAQMKADYDYFGDVVCFDTIHRKNKEGRPFALFVGVNHHKQTTIFGAALLYDETTSTFSWLFDTFAKAMSGKRPKTMLTDQDAAMAKALAMEWPETCHRLCIWHIYQNAATHLSHVFTSFTSFSTDFTSCIYHYEEEEDFIRAWNHMLEKYGLQSNEWLERLFKIREKWALVYGRQSFCADMTTTQRSESMNSVLKRYVSYKHSLLQFFQHFDRLIDDRRFEELKADLKASQSTPSLTFPIQILKHAAAIYTYSVFKLFEKELSRSYDSKVDLCSDTEEILLYKVTPFRRHYQFSVAFHSSRTEVSCSCKKFEFVGILCSHALKVLSLNHVVQIPALYIMKRWTKKAKKNTAQSLSKGVGSVTSESIDENEEKKLMGVYYRELCSLNSRLATRAALTSGTFEIVKNGLLKLIEEVDTYFENTEPNRTVFGSKSSKQSCILSRAVVKQTSATKAGERVSNEDGQTSNEVMIKGVKKKEKKPIKSGKRPRSGLEACVRKKRQSKAKRNGNNVQDVDNSMNTDTLLEYNSFPVQLYSLPAQLYPSSAQLSNSEAYQVRSYPNDGSSLSLQKSQELTHVVNPIINEQSNFAQYSEIDQQSEISLTKLLQAQEQLMMPQGFNRVHYDLTSEGQGSRDGRMW